MILRRNLAYLSITACALAFFAGAPVACAQSAPPPEVEIDWSVLQGGSGQPEQGSTAAGLSRPPVQQSWRPSLTPPPPQKPQQAAAPVPVPQKPVVQSFPVKTSSRTESTNPALAPSKAIPAVPVAPPPAPIPVASTTPATDSQAVTPLPDDILETAAADETNVPLPPKKPGATKSNMSALKEPPLPKRRPDVQMASAAFVTKARAQEQQKKTPMSRPEAPARQDGPRMAALPPGAVQSAPLKPGALPLLPEPPPVSDGVANDPLADRIVNPSKNELVKAIETIGKTKLSLFGAGKKKQGATRVEAQPLKKPDMTPETSAGNLAAIAPAAGDATARIQRPPPQEKYEEDYISLKFSPGENEPGGDAAAQMQEDVLRQLENNPGWRVQIQAFASPAGEGVSSARRISLSRALAIRTWLMDRGIEASRMDVRALGAETDRQPLDRVDLVIFDPKNG